MLGADSATEAPHQSLATVLKICPCNPPLASAQALQGEQRLPLAPLRNDLQRQRQRANTSSSSSSSAFRLHHLYATHPELTAAKGSENAGLQLQMLPLPLQRTVKSALPLGKDALLRPMEGVFLHSKSSEGVSQGRRLSGGDRPPAPSPAQEGEAWKLPTLPPVSVPCSGTRNPNAITAATAAGIQATLRRAVSLELLPATWPQRPPPGHPPPPVPPPSASHTTTAATAMLGLSEGGSGGPKEVQQPSSLSPPQQQPSTTAAPILIHLPAPTFNEDGLGHGGATAAATTTVTAVDSLLIPCVSCGRKFSQARLQAHSRICSKVSTNARTRGVFLSSSKRSVVTTTTTDCSEVGTTTTTNTTTPVDSPNPTSAATTTKRKRRDSGPVKSHPSSTPTTNTNTPDSKISSAKAPRVAANPTPTLTTPMAASGTHGDLATTQQWLLQRSTEMCLSLRVHIQTQSELTQLRATLDQLHAFLTHDLPQLTVEALGDSRLPLAVAFQDLLRRTRNTTSTTTTTKTTTTSAAAHFDDQHGQAGVPMHQAKVLARQETLVHGGTATATQALDTYFQASAHQGLEATLLERVQALRSLLRIKVEDNNDLHMATACLHDAQNFFRVLEAYVAAGAPAAASTLEAWLWLQNQ